MFGWTPLSLGGKHIPWRPWLKEIDMPRGFLCPITEGPCENGSCTRTRCSEQTSLEGRAELERMAYEFGGPIDPMTLIDPDPEKPVEGRDRNGKTVYFDSTAGRWRPGTNRICN